MFRLSGFSMVFIWRDYLSSIRIANIRARQAMNTRPAPRKVGFRSRPTSSVRIPCTAQSHAQRGQEKRRQFVQTVRAA